MMSTDKETNRLISEKSPYLLQHAYNPVDWHPWHEDAFRQLGRHTEALRTILSEQ